MSSSLFKTTLQSLVLTANNIATLNNDEVYNRVQPEITTLATSFTEMHNYLAQLEAYYAHCGFEFGRQSLENDILDYASLLKENEDALEEVMDYYLSGGLNDQRGRDKAAELASLLNSIISNCYKVCQIL